MAPRNKPCMAIKSADTVKVSPCHRVTQEKTNHESKAGIIVPFVQVSSVLFSIIYFIGCHGESPVFFHIGAGHSPYLILFANIHYQGNDDQILISRPFLVSNIRRQWLSQCCINCFGGEWGRVDDLFGASTCVMLLDLMLANMKDSWLFLVARKQPNSTCCEDHDEWYKEQFVMIPKAFRGWPIFLGGADFRILNWSM